VISTSGSSGIAQVWRFADRGGPVNWTASSFDWFKACGPGQRTSETEGSMQELPTIQPTLAPDLSPQEVAAISAEIRELAAARNAVILAHNYQLPEIQDVADHMGDSLGLSRRAAATDADVISFCGVHFMAETAAILSPEKTVLIPDLDAGCSLADSIDADQLRAWKAEHPGAQVVMYVNTSAEVKAETDYCCTSSNAVQVVEHIWAEHGPETEILFGPDMWLGAFVERETGLTEDPERRARFHVWDGECHVHAGIRPDDIARTRAENPEAEFLIHPECGCSTQAMEYVASGDIEADGVHMLSTSGMLQHVEANPDGDFVVATENGMLYPLQQAAPRANLIEANRMAFCKYMKMITLPKLRDSLRDLKFEVGVADDIAERARIPIERMVAIG
jgi:quinolinate synthase